MTTSGVTPERSGALSSLKETYETQGALMPRKLTFRQLLLSVLALRYEVSQKEIGARARMPEKNVSYHLRQERQGEMKDNAFERILAAIPCPPAAVALVTACLESLDALEMENSLAVEEKAEIEEGVQAASRIVRRALTESVRRSRAGTVEGYPEASGLDLDRARAEELFSRLVQLPEAIRPEVIRVAESFQSWALCEKVCAVSVEEASRDVERAAAWARLAEEIASWVSPELWRARLQGYAAAHGANALRVSGELKASEAAFERARRLWKDGADPLGVLDPGRLPDLEASLRRAQRRLAEALALLDEAAAVGRHPERALLKKGFTLEVLGEPERAVEILLQAQPLIERSGDPRLLYMLRFNLAVNYCHLGRFREASELVREVSHLILERGDWNEVLRVKWLEGRIDAGLGRRKKARDLLEQVRCEFGLRKMSYEVALIVLEEAVLLLEEGQQLEVKKLTQELREVFESKGVHREALAALRLFHEAAEGEQATAELARRVLRYLFRARYNEGLRFTS